MGLSIYTKAENCTDIISVQAGLDELFLAIENIKSPIPKTWAKRLDALYLKYQELKNSNPYGPSPIVENLNLVSLSGQTSLPTNPLQS